MKTCQSCRHTQGNDAKEHETYQGEWDIEETLTFITGSKERSEGLKKALNLLRAEEALDRVMSYGDTRLETMLVLDADRTLCAIDTGSMFWEILGKSKQLKDRSKQISMNPLKEIFSSPLGYSLNAFIKANTLYQEACDEKEFEETCKAVADKVILHPEFKSLLRRVKEDSHVGAVVITCGIREVWEIVMRLHGLSYLGYSKDSEIEIIGAGRSNNEYVVTAEVKDVLVERLQEQYGMHVWAFGDSPLDLRMLEQADEAIVVVGKKGVRSNAMDKELEDAIDDGYLVARQALLPSHATHRLDLTRLPLFDIRDPSQIDSIFTRRKPITVRHASTNAALLVQTPMRDGNISGVALQEVHKRVGWFLATELVTDVLPLEKYDIDHVQGGPATGYRLQHEDKTLIIALMRGGEPMAKGVHEAFPLATFLHAYDTDDLRSFHLADQKNVLLVDCDVNFGFTIVEFVKRIRRLKKDQLKIVVVAGVVQKDAIIENGALATADRDGLSVVAMNLNENKYTGVGGTDTGNRLFNTCHLE